MRIALITPEYPSASPAGGIGTNTAILARALRERGAEVVVITRAPGGRPHVGDIDIVQVRVPALPARLPGRRQLETIIDRTLVAFAVRRARPDVVHAAEWNAEAWLVARARIAPVVTRLATPTHVVEELNGRASAPNRLIHWLERDQTRRSARVYGPTTAVIERVAGDWGLDPGRIVRVPNSIDVGLVQRSATTTPAPASAAPGSIVFVGRLERRKGISVLADALPAVLAAHPERQVVLVGRDAGGDGGGVMHTFAARLGDASAQIHVLGDLRHDVAMATMAAAAVVVLPSLWESFGYVCVEAMALGRPVVASDVGGFREIVTDGVDGILVPPGDATALAAAIVRVLDDEQLAASLGRAAQRRSEAFDVAAIVPEVHGLLRSAAASSDQPITPAIHRGGYLQHFRPDERRDPFHDLYQHKRDAVVRRLADRRGLRVLDAGGGYGRISGQLAGTHDVVLFDLSSEMLGRVDRDAVHRVVQGDATRLPFDDSSFDAVVAIDLLVHLPDLEGGVRELVRVLRPGGTLVVDSTNAVPWWVLAYPAYVNWRPRRLVRTLRAGGVLPEWTSVVRHHRAGEIRSTLERAGVDIDGMEPFGPRWTPKWQLWHGTRR